MGYRSDLACAIWLPDATTYAVFKQYLIETPVEMAPATELRPAAMGTFVDEFGGFSFYDKHQTVIWQGVGLKWYPDYPDVRAFEAMLHRVSTEYGGEYKMVRADEEIEDVQKWESDGACEIDLPPYGTLSDLVYVHTEVEVRTDLPPDWTPSPAPKSTDFVDAVPASTTG